MSRAKRFALTRLAELQSTRLAIEYSLRRKAKAAARPEFIARPGCCVCC
jgi:hypothetical protein